MHKKRLCPEFFTLKTGAYSHGLSVDIGKTEFIYLSALVAMNEWGIAVAPGDYAKQAEYIFKKICELLNEADASLQDIVRVVIYINNMKRYREVANVRDRYLADVKPVTTVVEINRTHKDGCDLEIEVTAIREKRDH